MNFGPISSSSSSSNYSFLNNLENCDPELKPILTTIFSLHLCSTLERNLTQLLTLGIITPEQVSYHS